MDYEDEEDGILTDDSRTRNMPRPVASDNWVQALAFEAALEYFTPDELKVKFDLDDETYRRIQGLPEFRKAVVEYRREIDDEGIAFRLRARKAAEDMLCEMYAMAYDQTIAASCRLDAMKTVCEYAGLKPAAKDKAQDGGIKLAIYTNLSLGEDRTTGQTYSIEATQ